MLRPSEKKENPGSHVPGQNRAAKPLLQTVVNPQSPKTVTTGHGSIKTVFLEHVRSEVVTGNQIAIGAAGILTAENFRTKG
jgi:hypothetical protein